MKKYKHDDGYSWWRSSMIYRYLDLLSDAFMVRQLKTWHANIRKRQVKSPKIYIHDSGLLHQLLGEECKRTDAPRMTSSICVALTELKLDRVIVVYPGERRFSAFRSFLLTTCFTRL